MKRGSLHTLLLLSAFAFFACKDDDTYIYPPVRLEFLTAESGSDGCLQTIITDKGERLPVAEDRTKTRIKADTLKRFISNYELLPESNQVRIYAIGHVLSVRPLPPSAPNFANGIKTDPLAVQSIWLGHNFLNVALLVKGQNFKHYFHFVEEAVVDDTATGRRTVKLLLYHDANGDFEAYTRRTYLSIPLGHYADGAREGGVGIQFRLYTNAGEVKTYAFDYLPAKN